MHFFSKKFDFHHTLIFKKMFSKNISLYNIFLQDKMTDNTHFSTNSVSKNTPNLTFGAFELLKALIFALRPEPLIKENDLSNEDSRTY
jgi:hypothetical protein